MLSIAYVCFFENGRISGPSNSMSSLAKYSSLNGYRSKLFSTSNNIDENFHLNGVPVCSFSDFVSEISSFDIVVMSGLFDFRIYKAARLCLKNNIKYIFSPRSNLMLNALKKGRFKKKIALNTYSGYILKYASAIHFLSEEERDNSVSLKNYSFVVRNGVSGVDNLPKTRKRKENLILFIGRLDIAHKGLDLLIDSIYKIQHELRERRWRVEIYGPGSSHNVTTIIKNNRLSDLVTVMPPIIGNEKFELYNKAKIFVHPSRYEGQPQAVIEAMSQGALPALTIGTNMQSYVSSILPCSEFSIEEYTETLKLALNLVNNKESFFEVESIVSNNFNWSDVSRDFLIELNRLNRP
ncbi:glycosyltransferase [Vibrio lentus]